MKPVRFKMPEVQSHCRHCKRPLDGSVSSPYLCWAVPVNGDTCTMCHTGQYQDLSTMTIPDASRAALERYLSLGTHTNV